MNYNSPNKAKLNLNIRRAVISDIKQLFNLNKECLPIYYSILDHLSMILSPNYIILVMSHNDILVGYIICEVAGIFGHVLSFGVKKEYRKHGVGTNLMNRLNLILKNQYMCKLVTLHVSVENEAAIGFYQKMGFNEDEYCENYYDCSQFICKDAYKLKLNI